MLRLRQRNKALLVLAAGILGVPRSPGGTVVPGASSEDSTHIGTFG